MSSRDFERVRKDVNSQINLRIDENNFEIEEKIDHSANSMEKQLERKYVLIEHKELKAYKTAFAVMAAILGVSLLAGIWTTIKTVVNDSVAKDYTSRIVKLHEQAVGESHEVSELHAQYGTNPFTDNALAWGSFGATSGDAEITILNSGSGNWELIQSEPGGCVVRISGWKNPRSIDELPIVLTTAHDWENWSIVTAAPYSHPDKGPYTDITFLGEKQGGSPVRNPMSFLVIDVPQDEISHQSLGQ